MIRSRALLVGGLLVVGLLLWWALPSGGDLTGTTAATAPAPVATATAATTATASTAAGTPARSVPAARSASAGLRSADLRTKARAVLAVVDATGAAPKGYVGGRRFMNDGRGGTAPLPGRSAGRTIVYHEYDVNPFREGVNRGPQRLVVGDDGSAYCTPDHYESWIRLR